ncbi:MAG: peptidylprolyl isomerase [Limisphaerales bacterium]
MKYITSTLAFVASMTLATYAVTADKPVDTTKTADKTAAAPADSFADPVVAKGKNFEIKKSKLEDAFIVYKANLNPKAPPVSEDQRTVIKSNLLDRLIFTELLLQKGTAADKTKAEADTDKYIADVKKQIGSETVFEAQVKSTGMSMDQFRKRALEQNICEIVLDREVKPTIKVDDADVKKFYDGNPAEFEKPEQVRAAHILISTQDKDTQQPLPPSKKAEKEKLAKEVKARADKGEDFGKLAKEFSEDPGSKDKGGEYTFPKGQMVPEFEAAAFSMKPGQISDLVETRFGYHIIKTIEKLPASKVEFKTVEQKIKDYLTGQEFQKKLPAYFDKLKKDADVQIVKAS